MKIIHYIPSIDRSSGGTTAYMQLLANELGKLVELHIVSHVSNSPVNIGNCQIHYIPTFKQYRKMKRQWQILLNEIKPDIVHINCCWMPECALIQKWSQESNYKTVLTPRNVGTMDYQTSLLDQESTRSPTLSETGSGKSKLSSCDCPK